MFFTITQSNVAFIVNWTLRNEFQWNLNEYENSFSKKNAFEIVVYKILAISFKSQVLMKNSSHAAKNTQPCYKGILFPSQHNI